MGGSLSLLLPLFALAFVGAAAAARPRCSDQRVGGKSGWERGKTVVGGRRGDSSAKAHHCIWGRCRPLLDVIDDGRRQRVSPHRSRNSNDGGGRNGGRGGSDCRKAPDTAAPLRPIAIANNHSPIIAAPPPHAFIQCVNGAAGGDIRRRYCIRIAPLPSRFRRLRRRCSAVAATKMTTVTFVRVALTTSAATVAVIIGVTVHATGTESIRRIGEGAVEGTTQ